MAANSDTIQDLTERIGRRTDQLKSYADIRKFMAKVIRQMYRDKITLEKGKSLVWTAAQLHKAMRDEQAPQSGNTFNTLVVAGDASPAVALALALNGGQPPQALTHSLQDGLVDAAGGGLREDGHGAPVAVRALPGSAGES